MRTTLPHRHVGLSLALAAAIAAPSLGVADRANAPAEPPQLVPSKQPRRYRLVPPPVYPGADIAFPQFDRFVQGPVRTAFEPGKVFVIEFFSTTCSHCEEAAPIVEDLVKTYSPKGFEFIAVTTEDEAKVREWLAKPEIAARVKHSIAADPDQSALKSLQFGTYRNSSPRFFVLKDGKVLWYGHPNVSAEPLKAIAEGTWSPDSVRAEFILDSLVSRAREQTTNLAKECEKNGRWSELIELYESVAAAMPDRASQFELQKFGTLVGAARMPVEGYRFGRELAVKYARSLPELRTLARTTLSAPKVAFRDLDFAMDMAVAADALGDGKDARAAELLALAHFSKGDREKAIANQERAIELQTDVKQKRTYQQALQRFKTAAPGPLPESGQPGPTPAAPPSDATAKP
jgi:thiol-disulfide isomerase/thioredoxin